MNAPGLPEVVDRWCDLVGVEGLDRPSPIALERFGLFACRPGVDASAVVAWESRHGYRLPAGLRAWLPLSDGLFVEGGPLIHPLSAIGPMVSFARVAGMVIEPESWFEMGNPGVETVCLELGYRSPGGDAPVFLSGDVELGTMPRLISLGFDAWLTRCLAGSGRPFWLAPEFGDLGDPWEAHRRNAPAPGLPESLRRYAEKVAPLILGGSDDRAVAARFGLTRSDVETITRHVQHAR